MTYIRIYQCFDVIFSILFLAISVLLVSKNVFLCFIFGLFIVFMNILTIPLLIRNSKLILALAFPTVVLMMVVNKQREPDKTIRVLPEYSSTEAYLLFSVLLIFSLLLISAVKIVYLFYSTESKS